MESEKLQKLGENLIQALKKEFEKPLNFTTVSYGYQLEKNGRLYKFLEFSTEKEVLKHFNNFIKRKGIDKNRLFVKHLSYFDPVTRYEFMIIKYTDVNGYVYMDRVNIF